MLFELIIFSVAIVALSIAFFTDLKTREVPDWVSYGLIMSALGIRVIFSLEFGWYILVSGLLGFVATLALAYLFYYTRQWGGGDSKLLMGIGAVIGITFPLNNSSLDLFWFMIALLFIGAIWGILSMGYLALQEKKKFSETFSRMLKGHKHAHISLGTLMLLFVGLTFLYHTLWPIIFFPLGFFYLFIFVNAVEKSCFLRKVSPKKLTEGDWLAENVVIRGKNIIMKKTLVKNDVRQLQELEKKKKLKTVLIKEGIPFVPSFLFAYLLIVFGKDLISWVLKGIFG